MVEDVSVGAHTLLLHLIKKINLNSFNALGQIVIIAISDVTATGG